MRDGRCFMCAAETATVPTSNGGICEECWLRDDGDTAIAAARASERAAIVAWLREKAKGDAVWGLVRSPEYNAQGYADAIESGAHLSAEEKR